MNVEDFRYLLVTVETGSFSDAAQSLGVHPATISRRILRLENQLGITVLERGSFGIRTTAAGRNLMPHVRHAVESFDAVARAAKNSGVARTGRLRLGVRMPPMARPLQSLLTDWRSQHPGIVLTLHELNDNQIVEALAERTLDAAFMMAYAPRRGASTLSVYSEPLVAALPAEHRLASYDALTWDLLRNETVLTQGWDDSHWVRAFYISLLGKEVTFSPHPASEQSIMSLVSAGFGVTLATQSQAEAVFPGVVYKPILEENALVQIDLAWRPTAEDAATGRFVAFIRDEARSRGLL